MIKNNMNENPPIVQRITSASQVDAYRGNSIYELITDKNGRRVFVHRDGAEFNRFIKPNCEKRLFYYINTGDLELSYRFDDVYYCSERLSADVKFKVRLCPAVDLELNPEFADWIVGRDCEFLSIGDLADSLSERLEPYFSAILNGATTLALIEQHGAGAVSDDKTYWTDAGLPSWLEIVETSSIQALGEASQELIKENDRIARAGERQRNLLERIDIVVTEDKLANVKDEIAHRNDMLRKQRELEIARINRLKHEEVLKLELSEIERDYIEACHDVDYKIKCSDLELKKVQVQEKLRKIENESRESETRVKKLEQEIKESQARIDAIIRPKTWMFLIAWFLFGLMVALGVVSYFFVEYYSEKQKERDIINAERQKKIEEEKLLRERHETEKTARQKAIVASVALKYQTLYDELKNSYRYYGWRTNHFIKAKKLIEELRDLEMPQDAKVFDVVTQNVCNVIKEIKCFDIERIDKELLFNSSIEKWLKLVRDRLNEWPDELDEKKDLHAVYGQLLNVEDAINRGEGRYDLYESLISKVKIIVYKNYKEEIVNELERVICSNDSIGYSKELMLKYDKWCKEINDEKTSKGIMRLVLKGRTILIAMTIYPEFKATKNVFVKISEKIKEVGMEDVYSKRIDIGELDGMILKGIDECRDVKYFTDIVALLKKEISLRKNSIKIIENNMKDCKRKMDLYKRKCKDLLYAKKYEEIKKISSQGIEDGFKSIATKWLKIVKFMESADTAAVMINKLKQVNKKAYDMFCDYYDGQNNVSAIIDNSDRNQLLDYEKKLDLGKIDVDFCELLRVSSELGVKSLVEEGGYALVFANEILSCIKEKSVPRIVQYYMILSTGEAYYRMATIYRYNLYLSIVNGESRRIRELDCLGLATKNGCSEAEKILRKEKGF